jgi:acetyl esterase
MQYIAVRLLAQVPDRMKIALSGEPAIVVEGQQLDPMVQLLRASRRRRGFQGLIHPSIEAGRRRYRRETRDFRGPATAVRDVRELTIDGPAGALRLRHYIPDSTVAPVGLLVYLHGGGFVIGDLETHDEPCRILCRHGATHVLSVDYRLAPEHPFPAAVEDATAAFAWACANASTLGCDPGRVSIGGDSAGANLAAVVALSAPVECRPAAQMLIYPATEVGVSRPSQSLFGDGYLLTRRDCTAFFRHYVGDSRTTDARVAPAAMGNLSAAPPAFVVIAGFDVLRDEGEAFAAALGDAGVAVRLERCLAFEHGFIHLTGICPSVRRAMHRIGHEWSAFVDQQRRAADVSVASGATAHAAASVRDSVQNL